MIDKYSKYSLEHYLEKKENNEVKEIQKSFFLSISEKLFKPKLNPQLVIIEKSQDVQEMEMIFSHALKNSNYSYLKEMMKNGYILNDSQKKDISDNYNYFIKNGYDKNLINYHELNLPMTNNNYHHLFFKTFQDFYYGKTLVWRHISKLETIPKYYDYEFKSNDVNNRNNHEEYKIQANKYMKILEPFLNKNSNVDNLFKNWLHLITDDNETDSTLLLAVDFFYETHIKLLSFKEQEDIFNKTEDFFARNYNNQYNSSSRERFKNSLLDYQQSKIDDLGQKTKNLFLNNNNEIKFERLNSNNLSNEAKLIILNIETLYNKIISTNNVDNFYLHESEKLIKEKLSQITKEFLNIDDTFKQSLKNIHGKTAEELLLDSLNNIEIKVNQIYKSVNEDKITSMSILNRYTKKLN